MTKPKKLTHEQHLEVAQQIRDTKGVLIDLYYDHIQPIYGKSHGVSEALMRTIRSYEKLQHVLDVDYHSVTSEEQFIDRGHVYYQDRVSNEGR